MKQKYLAYIGNKSYRNSAVFSFCAFLFGLFMSWEAGQYAVERASNPVTDLILSNTPSMDLSAVFVISSTIFIVFVTALLLYRPQYIPFTLFAIALFLLVRSGFMTLTHLGPFPGREFDDLGQTIANVAAKSFLGADYFFSGHTGFPFLMALMFWHNYRLRYFFLGSSVLGGAVVLLAHLHYSIDVAAAFFISYGIFHIAEWAFPKERRVFFEGLPAQR